MDAELKAKKQLADQCNIHHACPCHDYQMARIKTQLHDVSVELYASQRRVAELEQEVIRMKKDKPKGKKK